MSWSSAENLRRIGGVPSLTLTEASSFPVDLTREGNGLLIANNDTTTALIVRVYFKDSSLDFRVEKNLNIQLEKFFRVGITQASTSYDIIVVSPGGES